MSGKKRKAAGKGRGLVCSLLAGTTACVIILCIAAMLLVKGGVSEEWMNVPVKTALFIASLTGGIFIFLLNGKKGIGAISLPSAIMFAALLAARGALPEGRVISLSTLTDAVLIMAGACAAAILTGAMRNNAFR